MAICALVICGVAPARVQNAQPQKTFDAATTAADALIDAALKNDETQIAAIFGPRDRNTLVSGDADQNKQGMAEFARLAMDKHRLEPGPHES